MNETGVWADRHKYSLYILWQNVWIALFQLVSIALISLLLHSHAARNAKFQVKAMSQSMRFYLGSELAMVLSSIPYRAYLIALNYSIVSGRRSPLENVHVLFWSGLSNNINYIMQPIPVTILAVDRCLALAMVGCRRCLFRLSVALFCALYALNLSSYLFMYIPLDTQRASKCLYYACINSPAHNIFLTTLKCTQGILNLLCALTFFILLRQRRQQLSVRNRTVRFAMLTEILMNVLPNFITIYAAFMLGIHPVDLFGEYGSMLTVTDLAVCSIYYSLILLKRRRWTPSNRQPSLGQTTLREALESNPNDTFL